VKVFLVTFILLLSCPTANAEWSKQKTARELFFFASLANDWHQTTVISRTPWRLEKNKLLGRKPHRDNVNIYFSGCLMGHVVIAYFLPEEYAKVWQDIWIGIESCVSDSNVKVGHTEKVRINYKLTHTIKF